MRRRTNGESRRVAPLTTPSLGPLLTDAGPLIALASVRQRRHADCLAVLARLRQPLVTTWPALAEAMHIAGRDGGWQSQDRLWQLLARDQLLLASPHQPYRAAELMARYRDVPMDLADATLIAVAEQDGHRRVFTLDSDFYVYRLATGQALEVLP